MDFFKRFKSLINQLLGDKQYFNLEERILHATLIAAIFAVSLICTFNFLVGFILYAFILLGCAFVLTISYYLSRIKKQFTISIHIIAIASNLLCAVTYFDSYASSGTNLYILLATVFILSFVSPIKIWAIWIPITFINVVMLFVLEYLNPEWINNYYYNPQVKLLDIAQIWLVFATMISVLIAFIRYYYNTERKLAQTRLKALEQINDNKNKLFSIISHDLRAPLASIENYLSNLNQLDISAEEKRFIEQNLLQNTKQTSQMLQNMLHWSKDQMSGVHVNMQNINLLNTLKATIELGKIIAEEKHIQIEVDIHPHLDIKADPYLLQIVVRNILNNAVKFSFKDSQIIVKAIKNKSETIISVSDQGFGIDSKLKDSIFELNGFSHQGTNQETGVGLGLVLAKNYVEIMSGKIWFESQANQGTTFYISLASA